ncbi:glycosyltransferase [Acinetobacter ursingii]|uniref:glycosyltransferase n=1 Tax=Acinetobacter ursingii TaxID=108980 RepID=UPI003AF6ED98
MKVLYIGQDLAKISSGADSVNKRNLDLLKDIFKSQLYVYSFANADNSLIEKVQGYLGGCKKLDIVNVIELIKKFNFEYVFFSQSFYGKLCVGIKKKCPNVKVITFYHNIEKHYAREFLRVSGVKHFLFYISVSYNELLIANNSDYNIVLNERDSLLLNEIYGVESNLNLPVSYKDCFDVRKVVTNSVNPSYLFVGTAFFANIQAVDYFIEKVLPYIKGDFIVVGKGMEQFKNKWSIDPRVHIYGFVEDLSIFYYSASAVVAPILSGGGMKTKVAEALMYGKVIVGTNEAFEGYEINDDFMYVAHNSDKFINIINNLYLNKEKLNFNINSRNHFKRNYENEAIKFSFQSFFDSLDG